jgi:4'-phosphopantetheinyl transferase
MLKLLYSRIEDRISQTSFIKLLNTLPGDLVGSIIKYRNWEDQHTSLIGKLLLIEGLKSIGIKKPNLSLLKYTSFNRPYFNYEIDFNISHSGRSVICAISNEFVVGIDIEEIKPIRINDFDDLWTNQEFHFIMNSSDRYYTFYKYWTRKEAVLKANGQGLNIALSSFDVTNNIVAVDLNTWYINELRVANENVVIHLASSTQVHIKNEIEKVCFYK